MIKDQPPAKVDEEKSYLNGQSLDDDDGGLPPVRVRRRGRD